MEPICLLHRLLTVQSSLPPMQEHDDHHAEDAGPDQGDPGQEDAPARGDVELGLPPTRVERRVWDDVHLGVGNDLGEKIGDRLTD